MLYVPPILHEVLKLIPTLPSVQLGVAHDTGDVTVILWLLHAVDDGVIVNTAFVPTGILITVLPDTVPALLVTVPLVALKLTV
jgi:hypothetical protein